MLEFKLSGQTLQMQGTIILTTSDLEYEQDEHEQPWRDLVNPENHPTYLMMTDICFCSHSAFTVRDSITN